MTKEPKISVLMPCYNTPENFLRMAIESILSQTFTDFEFLILNDGSTNNAGEIINAYAKKDDRIRVFHHKINKNCPNSRNELLENAKGIYVANMDSDDVAAKDRLQKQYDYMEENKDVSILGSYIEVMDDANPRSVSEIVKYPKNIQFLDILRGCQIANNTVIMRFADIKKYNLKYNEDFESAEDYEFWSRAVKYLKIQTLEEVLMQYRMGHASLSSSKRALTIENDEKVKKSMVEFLTDDPKLGEKVRKMVEIKPKYTFFERIFSLKSIIYRGKKYKVICILGLILKFEREI